MFTKEQPDWNWKNEDVRADFIKTLRFWLDHGADGFRVDVAHGLAKDLDRDDLDDYVVWCTNDQPEDGSHPVIDRDEVHDIYHEWRKVFNEYDPPAFAVAEAWVRPSRQHLYASPDDLGQIFNFEFAKKDWIRDDMHLAIEEGLESAERSGSTATWVMSNHDVVRHATRYALPQVPTGFDLNVLDEGVDYVIKPSQKAVDHMNDFVRAMHTRSGLINEWEHGLSLDEAQAKVIEYVRKFTPAGVKPLLAGNTIGSDKKFLDHYMPELMENLHYRTIDVSTFKELARRWYPAVYLNRPPKNGGHRALADIIESLDELRYYRKAFMAPVPGPSEAEAKAIASEIQETSLLNKD